MLRREFLRLTGLAAATPLLASIKRWSLLAPVLSGTASTDGTTAVLSWTDAGDETSYIVLRGLSSTALSPIAVLSPDTLTYQDTP